MSKPSPNRELKSNPSQEPCARGLLGFPDLSRWMPWKAVRAARAGGSGCEETVVEPALEALPPAAPSFTLPEQQFLLRLARRALERAAVDGEAPLEANAEDCPPRVMEPAACFVTLTRKGELRGCVGSLLAQAPLCQAIGSNAHIERPDATRVFRPSARGRSTTSALKSACWASQCR
jgi:hypothetical protein